MNQDELIIKDRERNQDIVVKILKMPRGIFIWIGLDSSDFGMLKISSHIIPYCKNFRMSIRRSTKQKR